MEISKFEIKNAKKLVRPVCELLTFYEEKTWQYQAKIFDTFEKTTDVKKARKIVLEAAKILEADGVGILTEEEQRDFHISKLQVGRLVEALHAINIILEM